MTTTDKIVTLCDERTTTEQKDLMREMESYARAFMAEHFSEELHDFNFVFKINNRLKRAEGRFGHKFGYSKSGSSALIELNGMLVQYESYDNVKKVVEHECTHLGLWYLDKPYHDSDPYFQTYCIANDIPLQANNYITKYHLYACPNGDYIYPKMFTKFPKGRYGCPKCREKLQYCMTLIGSDNDIEKYIRNIIKEAVEEVENDYINS